MSRTRARNPAPAGPGGAVVNGLGHSGQVAGPNSFHPVHLRALYTSLSAIDRCTFTADSGSAERLCSRQAGNTAATPTDPCRFCFKFMIGGNAASTLPDLDLAFGAYRAAGLRGDCVQVYRFYRHITQLFQLSCTSSCGAFFRHGNPHCMD